VPDHRATLAANMETAINGLWDAGPRLGDRIAVLGAGAVGMLVAVLAARLPGTRVEMIEPNPSRAAIARALGLRVVTPAAAQGDVDLVIHASGSPEGLATGLGLAGFEATVVEMSWYGDRMVPLPLGEAFHSRRLVLKSSQVGAVAGAPRARWTTSRRLALALELLRDAIFDRLIGERIAFAELPAAMPRIVARVDGPPCSVVVYDT
jgi:threonine dehydrogenase-like Zn-dependent dehydrogenase